jgi:ABC-2 type transport system permease protein
VIRRALAVAVKELLQLRRDPRTAFTLLGMPLVLLLIYGFALSFDVEHIRLAVVDLDNTHSSRALREAFVHSGHFDLVAGLSDVRQAAPLLDDGSVQATLVIPADLERALHAGEVAEVQLVVDGSDSQTATTLLGYASQIVAAQGARLAGTTPPVVGRVAVWYNPELTSSIFLVPGLLAFILMVSSVIATALAVVREKERGTMESLRATPLEAVELLIGKTAPYLLVASVAAAASLAVAWALFEVPVRGSLVWLAVVTVLYLAGGLGWGVLLSTLADSQQVAFQLGLLSSMLPTLILSGFVFPITSMPAALRLVSHLVPARYYIAALREIVLKGAGPEVWLDDAVALVAYGLVVLGLAVARTMRSL